MRKQSELGTVLANVSNWRARPRRRRLSFNEILAELDERPEPGRPVCGYQVKVGSERHPYWLLSSGDKYVVTNNRPSEPPFVTECDASLARTWFIETMPDVPTLCEPVYTTAVLPVAV